MHIQEEQKPRSRHEKLFINVGSAALAGGFFGLLSAGAVLKQRKFLNLKSFKHPVKRSEIITAIVNNCRLRSGQFGSFGESFHHILPKTTDLHIFQRSGILDREGLSGTFPPISTLE